MCTSRTTPALKHKFTFEIHVVNKNDKISPTNDAFKTHENFTFSNYFNFFPFTHLVTLNGLLVYFGAKTWINGFTLLSFHYLATSWPIK